MLTLTLHDALSFQLRLEVTKDVATVGLAHGILQCCSELPIATSLALWTSLVVAPMPGTPVDALVRLRVRTLRVRRSWHVGLVVFKRQPEALSDTSAIFA